MDLTGSSTNAYTEHPQSGVVPDLEKVEEVTGFYIDVSGI